MIMNVLEARASLRVLFEVARADGKLTLDEKELLALVAKHEYDGHHPPASQLDDNRDLEDALSAIQSEEARRLTWKASLALATIDGKCSKSEHRVLMRIHESLVPDEPAAEVRDAEQDYKWRLKEVRNELDEATKAFLSQVAQATSGEHLSIRAYEALSRELEEKKAALYAQALSIPPPKL